MSSVLKKADKLNLSLSLTPLHSTPLHSTPLHSTHSLTHSLTLDLQWRVNLMGALTFFFLF